MRSFAYHFDLTYHLVHRDFSLRYKRSLLGILWSLMTPLAQLFVLAFLFNVIVPLNIDAYPAFVFSALLPWTWFNTCLNSAGSLFITNRDLIRKPDFKPAILIIINTLSNLLNYLIAIPVLCAILIYYDKAITLALLALPLLIFIQCILITGLSLIIATLNVFYRDIQHIMSMILMLLFYLTPVFYRPNAVVERYHRVYELNPMAVLVQSYRAIFFYGTYPEWKSILLVSIVSSIFCCLSYFIYKCYLHDIVDAI